MSSSFSITPMNQSFSLNPGTTTEGYISVINPADSTEDFHYQMSVSPYGVKGERYEADLTTESSYTSISKWIKIEEPTGTVAPNGVKKVKFTITVPENAPGGGQYATIKISSADTAQETGGLAVQNVFEMASIIYGSVNGETVRGGEVKENNIPGFTTGTPTLTALIENTGNIHEYATYVITVKDFFTGRVILPTEEEDGEYSEVIMPETTYMSQREISNLPAVGVVKVTQTIYYNGKSYPAEGNIVICPIWFMALVGATLLALTITIIAIVKKHRSKKSQQAF